mmetsp:Transcript_5130/g.16763  ORF Transcript_5130/g.16763 Transcript_5130/m.16763 type:complete len:282 (-) Transcript_5130:1988-2833(-)
MDSPPRCAPSSWRSRGRATRRAAPCACCASSLTRCESPPARAARAPSHDGITRGPAGPPREPRRPGPPPPGLRRPGSYGANGGAARRRPGAQTGVLPQPAPLPPLAGRAGAPLRTGAHPLHLLGLPFPRAPHRGGSPGHAGRGPLAPPGHRRRDLRRGRRQHRLLDPGHVDRRPFLLLRPSHGGAAAGGGGGGGGLRCGPRSRQSPIRAPTGVLGAFWGLPAPVLAPPRCVRCHAHARRAGPPSGAPGRVHRKEGRADRPLHIHRAASRGGGRRAPRRRLG